MNFKIYIIGEKIEKFYLEGIKEYEKRLNRYCKIQLQKFKNEESLLMKISDKQYKIFVSTKGKTISSEELAEKIDKLGITGRSDVVFILSDGNIPHDEKLAISPLEMTVGLQTTIMFEQIYRAYRILYNQPYHK